MVVVVVVEQVEDSGVETGAYRNDLALVAQSFLLARVFLWRQSGDRSEKIGNDAIERVNSGKISAINQRRNSWQMRGHFT